MYINSNLLQNCQWFACSMRVPILLDVCLSSVPQACVKRALNVRCAACSACLACLGRITTVNFYSFFIQFYVPFKIISANMRRANQ